MPRALAVYAIGADDASCSRHDRDFIRDVVPRNGDIGRHLARHARAAALHVCRVTVSAGLFTEHEPADTILGMDRNVERAIASGQLSGSVRQRAASLRTGHFVAALLVSIVTVEQRALRKPAWQ